MNCSWGTSLVNCSTRLLTRGLIPSFCTHRRSWIDQQRIQGLLRGWQTLLKWAWRNENWGGNTLFVRNLVISLFPHRQQKYDKISYKRPKKNECPFSKTQKSYICPESHPGQRNPGGRAHSKHLSSINNPKGHWISFFSRALPLQGATYHVTYCSNRTVHTAGNEQRMMQQATKRDPAPFFRIRSGVASSVHGALPSSVHTEEAGLISSGSRVWWQGYPNLKRWKLANSPRKQTGASVFVLWSIEWHLFQQKHWAQLRLGKLTLTQPIFKWESGKKLFKISSHKRLHYLSSKTRPKSAWPSLPTQNSLFLFRTSADIPSVFCCHVFCLQSQLPYPPPNLLFFCWYCLFETLESGWRPPSPSPLNPPLVWILHNRGGINEGTMTHKSIRAANEFAFPPQRNLTNILLSVSPRHLSSQKPNYFLRKKDCKNVQINTGASRLIRETKLDSGKFRVKCRLTQRWHTCDFYRNSKQLWIGIIHIHIHIRIKREPPVWDQNSCVSNMQDIWFWKCEKAQKVKAKSELSQKDEMKEKAKTILLFDQNVAIWKQPLVKTQQEYMYFWSPTLFSSSGCVVVLRRNRPVPIEFLQSPK